jgi:hypothetical protein
MLSVGLHELWPNVHLHVFEAEVAGPTVLVQAGIHGDEIAGVHALEELLEEGLRPARGRLLIIPVMNPPAYRARERAAPGGLDLNRCFPGREDGAREERLARVLMSLVLDEKPAVMATLHESWKRHHPDFPVSFGQTVTYGVEPRPPIVDRLCERMNEALENPYERWAPHYYPVATSSTEVIVDALQRLGVDPIAGLCIETWMGFPLARRVAMQKRVVRLILDEAGVLPFQG